MLHTDDELDRGDHQHEARRDKRLDRIAELEAEVERLNSDNARLIEDRARFPDRPDDIGRMISAHIKNRELLLRSMNEHTAALRLKYEVLQQREWKLGAEVEQLRALVTELAAELEAEVKARFCASDGTLLHPCYERRLRRDMEPVERALRVLAGKG